MKIPVPKALDINVCKHN